MKWDPVKPQANRLGNLLYETALFLYVLLAHGQICLKVPQVVPGVLLFTDVDLANLLGKMDFYFENLQSLEFLSILDLTFPDFQIPGWAWAWVYICVAIGMHQHPFSLHFEMVELDKATSRLLSGALLRHKVHMPIILHCL